MVRWLALMLLLLAIGISHAATANDATPNLRIVTESFPPYSYKNAQGEIDGAVAQVVKKLLHNVNISTQIEMMPWARAYNIALKNPNILIFSLVRIPPREELFHWLAPVTSINIGVYALPNSEGAKLDDLNQLNKMTIGVMRESSSINFFKSFSNVTDENLMEMATFEQLYKMLMNKRVNFVLAPELLIQFLNHQHQTPINEQPIPVYQLPLQEQSTMYLALSKNTDPQLVSRFKVAIARMQQQGEIKAIFDQYQQSLNHTR